LQIEATGVSLKTASYNDRTKMLGEPAIITFKELLGFSYLPLFGFALCIRLALKNPCAGLAGIVRPSFLLRKQEVKFSAIFHFLANPAAFSTIAHAVDSR
jgi:hypothetical protein